MTQALEDFQTIGIDYFQRWILAGYEVTIGHQHDGHFIELAAKGGLKARYTGYDSLAGLLRAFLITLRPKYPLTAPIPLPVLNPSAWDRYRKVTALCQKAVAEGLAPDADAARHVILNMSRDQFLAFRGGTKLSRIDFKDGEGDDQPHFVPPPPPHKE